MTSATLLTAGAIGVTGLASAASTAERASTIPQCPDICITIYKPVTCLMSNGSVRTFANRCLAEVFACEHPFTIVGCWPDDV